MLFGFKKNIFIGLDVGTSSIKMVELRLAENKPVLSNYAWLPLPEASGKGDLSSSYFTEALPDYLKIMFQEADFKGKDVYVSIPSFGGLITIIDFPRMAKEEMAQAIKFEAQKYVPTSLDDLVLSWDIVGESEDKKIVLENGSQEDKPNSGGKAQVILVAASKKKVIAYEKMASNAGLELKAIEIESFSLVSSLIGNDPGNFIIIDIGSRVGNILLVEKGIIRSNRNIDAGGRDMTRMIAKAMGLDEQAAEKMKVSGRNFFDASANINFPTLESINNEVSRMINLYYKNETSKVNSIILSGGAANFTGLAEHFQNSLKIKTVIGNPFSRLEYDKRLEPILAKIGNRFSVAVGLALRGINESINKK